MVEDLYFNLVPYSPRHFANWYKLKASNNRTRAYITNCEINQTQPFKQKSRLRTLVFR